MTGSRAYWQHRSSGSQSHGHERCRSVSVRVVLIGPFSIGGDLLFKNACVARLSALSSRQIEGKFQHWSSRPVQSKAAWGQGWRDASMEVVRFDPIDATAQTQGRWFCGQERGDAQSRSVRETWAELIRQACQFPARRPDHRELCKEEEHARRGGAAQNRVQQGQVSRARQELTGATLAPRDSDTLEQSR